MDNQVRARFLVFRTSRGGSSMKDFEAREQRRATIRTGPGMADFFSPTIPQHSKPGGTR
jgi:hypothetical protein